MTPQKKTKKMQLNTHFLDEEACRMKNYRRAISAYEHEMLYRALKPLGCPDILEELDRPLKAKNVNEHPLIEAYYPLHLEIPGHGVSNPPPMPWDKPMPPLKRMIFEFPDTVFHHMCIRPKAYKHPDSEFGHAVVFVYRDEGSLILHNRPDFTEGPARVSKQLPNGCLVQIHDFPPFIDDIADLCRHLFAEEGSELEELFESNFDFREAYWSE